MCCYPNANVGIRIVEALETTGHLAPTPKSSHLSIVIAAATHESSCLGTGTDAFNSENHMDRSNEASMTEKQQTDSISSSLVTEVPQQNCPMDKKRQNRDGSYLNSAESKVEHLIGRKKNKN